VSPEPVRLGLRENLPQFSLLVAVNAFVGAMVGLERSTLPLIGRDDFGVSSTTALASFIVAFGLAKAFTNLGAGVFADRLGRRRLLVVGWALALPVPALILAAPSWSWIVAANVLLGLNQGLAWSMTVVMKIDLVGPKRRGLALGLNEAAGYAGVALAAVTSGWLAADFAPRDVLVVGGSAVAVGDCRCRSCSCATRRGTWRSSNARRSGASASLRLRSAAPSAMRPTAIRPFARAHRRAS